VAPHLATAAQKHSQKWPKGLGLKGAPFKSTWTNFIILATVSARSLFPGVEPSHLFRHLSLPASARVSVFGKFAEPRDKAAIASPLLLRSLKPSQHFSFHSQRLLGIAILSDTRSQSSGVESTEWQLTCPLPPSRRTPVTIWRLEVESAEKSRLLYLGFAAPIFTVYT